MLEVVFKGTLILSLVVLGLIILDSGNIITKLHKHAASFMGMLLVTALGGWLLSGIIAVIQH